MHFVSVYAVDKVCFYTVIHFVGICMMFLCSLVINSCFSMLFSVYVHVLCDQANAIGRSAKTVREFLEKHYSEDQVATDRGTIKLALKALLEVVQSGSKNMEVAVMQRREPLRVRKAPPSSGSLNITAGKWKDLVKKAYCVVLCINL